MDSNSIHDTKYPIHDTPERVFVGLSGGVDSAVAAALLKQRGYDVTGVFIKIWSPEFLECTWREDRLDAMRVAVHLDIPFLEIDLSDKYKEMVVSDMIAQYKAGRTPNPDVLCNEFVKFGAFAEWAVKVGADYIATGHYARTEDGKLFTGIDPSKDQSYFLYRVKGAVLRKTFFPVGEFTKIEIREKAKEFELPNAERPDSQGLCFVGDVSMPEFLGRFITLDKGTLINEKGAEIGTHDGAALYTIGQRHGFHLAADAENGPYYVTHIDTHKNIVHVSKTRTDSTHSSVTVSDIHWIGEKTDSFDAVPRYHGQKISATLHGSEVQFSNPIQVTPGQSLVFYNEDRCLGGAVIHSVR